MKKIVGIIIMTIFILAVINYPRTYQAGDINKDGKIDIMDLLLLRRYLLGMDNICESELYLLDFNQDGVINEKDIKALQNYLLGIEVGAQD